MALTDNCDVFGAIHEAGFNRIGRHLMQQRPSLFNYGTQLFASNPNLLCKQIDAHPEVQRRNNPLITVEDPLPIAGTGGTLGVDFCLQVTELRIDFHPNNEIDLPPELNPPLNPQRFALFMQVCGAIVCPDRRIAEQLGDRTADKPSAVGAFNPMLVQNDREWPRPPIRPIPGREVECFCLDVFAVAYVEKFATKLAMRLENLEIVDIQPVELENNLECYIATTLRVGILPRLRIALDTLDFELGKFLSISPTPTSASVPNNPALEEDQIKAFINVGVSS
jgi:hypothetical protein